MSSANTSLPTTETLLLEQRGHTLQIRLNRPQARNAMSLQMVRELRAVFDAVREDRKVRAIVLRGSEEHFCAGGDIRDMANARAALGKSESDPFYALNREFGRLITQVNQAPQVVVVLLEGAVLGGGFGLACVSDVAISTASAQFGLPETSLGVIPAQIAPFVVTRIGLTQARRLALLGARFDGTEAHRLGLVHYLCDNAEAAEAQLQEVLEQIKRCAPEANRVTKQLMLRVGQPELETLLDDAAASFAKAVQGSEGQEGTMAFMQKRAPSWAALSEE